MAVTSLWPIKGRIKAVIDYANDPSKVTARSQLDQAVLHSVSDVLEYAVDDIKTEKRVYVHGINCSPNAAADQFMATKRFWQKTGGRTAFHGYQSFQSGEVTAEQAHEIGLELARRLWGDRFEVMVATHLNTGHYHNHFVINSVSFRDGGKFYNSRKDYLDLRSVSDQICREFGLYIIENPHRSRKNYGEWAADQVDRPTRRSLIREDIDRAISQSVSSRDFIQALKYMGYELKLSGIKYPGLKPPGAKGFFRFHKLGEDYSLDAIRERILGNMFRNVPSPIARLPPRTVQFHGSLQNVKKLTGLQALYIRYCFELHILRKKPTSVRRVHFVLREDITKLDALTAQSKLLCRNRISTSENLRQYKSGIEAQIVDLAEQRKHLRKEARIQSQKQIPEAAETKAAIAEITDRLRQARKEIRLCEAIEARSIEIAENLRLLVKQKHLDRKEMGSDEHIRRNRRSSHTNELEWS